MISVNFITVTEHKIPAGVADDDYPRIDRLTYLTQRTYRDL